MPHMIRIEYSGSTIWVNVDQIIAIRGERNNTGSVIFTTKESIYSDASPEEILNAKFTVGGEVFAEARPSTTPHRAAEIPGTEPALRVPKVTAPDQPF